MRCANKKLIVNADDFGLTPAVTQGIIETFRNGIVTSTTALAVSRYFPEAMDAARRLAPDLPIGLHLTLTLHGYGPVLPADEVPSLVDDQGLFWHQQQFESKVDLDDVYREWDAQIATFIRSGRKPDHLDSHHNVHGRNEGLLRVALELAGKYDVPLRSASRRPETDYFGSLYGAVPRTDKIIPWFYDDRATEEVFESILDAIVEDESTLFEVNVHPSFVDAELQRASGYCMQRLREQAILTSPAMRAALRERHILLTNYAVLA